MKKRNSILKAATVVALCFVQGVWAQVWNGTIDTEWYWDNPKQAKFTLTTAEQLAGLAQLVNGGNNFSGKTIKLGANIVLNDTANYKDWENSRETRPSNIWIAIGTYNPSASLANSFSGTFDGNGHVVSGVYISNYSSDYQGLFGYVGSGGTIKNLGVTASFIYGGSFVGGLVGVSNRSTITDCYTTGTVKGYNHNVGGLVGKNEGSTVTNCYTTGNVQGDGGLVGSNEGTIKNCYATGKVHGAGGLVGSNKKGGTIVDSYATGNVQGSGSYSNAGGLAGSNSGAIKNCYATGEVQGHNVGGLVGSNEWGTITGCYATGDVNGSNVGGLVGYNSYKEAVITNCYATGEVRGYNAGGLMGVNSQGTITGCYATGDVNGSYAGGLVGENYSGIMTNCYAMGNVTGKDGSFSDMNANTAGGLVGSNGFTNYSNAEIPTITNCYAIGNVTGKKNVGGLVARNDGSIMSCYAAGNVSGTTSSSIGGLVGTAEKHSKVTKSYYDRPISGQVDINKGEPKSTVQMKQQTTFANWDFKKIWTINAEKNNGYPYLKSLGVYEIPKDENLTDKRDGKKYKIVKIGDQTWMAENLNYDANGSKCYGNNSDNCAKYGRLYDWSTATDACPSGWHLPNNDEWEVLSKAVGGDDEKLKANSDWNNNGMDEFGFSALPGGYGSSDGSFANVGDFGFWWSSNKGAYYYIGGDILRNNDGNNFLSIRCLKGKGERYGCATGGC